MENSITARILRKHGIDPSQPEKISLSIQNEIQREHDKEIRRKRVQKIQEIFDTRPTEEAIAALSEHLRREGGIKPGGRLEVEAARRICDRLILEAKNQADRKIAAALLQAEAIEQRAAETAREETVQELEEAARRAADK